jgi:quinolinate synthase
MSTPPLVREIRELAARRRAILLAHNYQPPEIQAVADLCGDSLELSIQAAATDAEVIVFCGVRFMAETAAILAPQKTVLLPREDAGCPMADMVTAPALRRRLSQLGPLPVVTYVNSSAAVKALSTICCTSANVLQVVASLPERELLMVPDRNLARFAAARSDKRIHFWDGFCPFHDRLTPEEVRTARMAHPEAVFMAHPECRPEITALADQVLSTSGMIRFARASSAAAFIVGTEVGLLHPLRQACPQKDFHPASGAMVCDEMKKIGLEDVKRCLIGLEGEVRVPEEVARPARLAVQRMLDLARGL